MPLFAVAPRRQPAPPATISSLASALAPPPAIFWWLNILPTKMWKVADKFNQSITLLAHGYSCSFANRRNHIHAVCLLFVNRNEKLINQLSLSDNPDTFVLHYYYFFYLFIWNYKLIIPLPSTASKIRVSYYAGPRPNPGSKNKIVQPYADPSPDPGSKKQNCPYGSGGMTI